MDEWEIKEVEDNADDVVDSWFGMGPLAPGWRKSTTVMDKLEQIEI